MLYNITRGSSCLIINHEASGYTIIKLYARLNIFQVFECILQIILKKFFLFSEL